MDRMMALSRTSSLPVSAGCGDGAMRVQARRLSMLSKSCALKPPGSEAKGSGSWSTPPGCDSLAAAQALQPVAHELPAHSTHPPEDRRLKSSRRMSRMGMFSPSCTISERLSACMNERLPVSSITIHALRLRSGGRAGKGRAAVSSWGRALPPRQLACWPCRNQACMRLHRSCTPQHDLHLPHRARVEAMD